MQGAGSFKLQTPPVGRVQTFPESRQADRPDLRIPFSLMARRTVSGNFRVEGREPSRLVVEMPAAVNGIHVGTQKGTCLVSAKRQAIHSAGEHGWHSPTGVGFDKMPG